MLNNSMKILYFTNMYPSKPGSYSGIFIKKEIEELKKIGLKVECLFVNGKESKLNYLNIFRIMTALKDNYDIINVHHSLLLPHTLFLRKILNLDIPVVFTLHEGELGYLGKAMNIQSYIFHSKLWRKPLFQYVDLIIAKNIDIFEKMQVNVKCVEIPTSADTEMFQPITKEIARKHLGIPDKEFILFFPADKYRPEKNYSFIEHLIPKIKDNIQKNVTLLNGPIPYEKMVWFYNAADIIIFPSFYECSPVVIKEAMACNRPIVASNVGDIKRVIGNILGCYVIDGWNEEEYITHILRAAQIVSTDGRKRIFEQGYDWIQTGKKIYDTFMTVINNYS